MEKKKIAIVTGTRAEYGYLKPLIQKIEKHPHFSLLLYVTGMHLVKDYGYTINEIKDDGLNITKTIDMNIKSDNSEYDIAVSISRGIEGFAETFKDEKPDIVILFGDRIEPFAAAIAATAMNIPIVHISGGEVGLGDIDDNLRHAITKLAHIHFTSSNLSKKRVIKLGEEPWRVFKVGALSLDVILNKPLLEKKEMLSKYNLQDKSIILLCYHPTTTETRDIERQIKNIMMAVTEVVDKENFEIVVVYPNAYPGGYQIIQTINNFKKKTKNINLFENLPHIDFISIMSISKVFIGNSSSGIIEAPSLGTPYVCIGTRQEGRERADNVIDTGYEKEEIKNAIKKALFDKEFLSKVKKRKTPYGNGNASSKIIKALEKIKVNKKLVQKKFIT